MSNEDKNFNKKIEKESDFLFQLTSSIQSLFDLTSRLDERVKYLTHKEKELENKLDDLVKSRFEANARIKVMEKEDSKNTESSNNIEKDLYDIKTRVKSLEVTQNSAESRWKTIATFVIQLIWVILAAYLLTKLGIQSPSVP